MIKQQADLEIRERVVASIGGSQKGTHSFPDAQGLETLSMMSFWVKIYKHVIDLQPKLHHEKGPEQKAIAQGTSEL